VRPTPKVGSINGVTGTNLTENSVCQLIQSIAKYQLLNKKRKKRKKKKRKNDLRDIRMMVLEIFGALWQTPSGAGYPARHKATLAGSLTADVNTLLMTFSGSRAKD